MFQMLFEMQVEDYARQMEIRNWSAGERTNLGIASTI